MTSQDRFTSLVQRFGVLFENVKFYWKASVNPAEFIRHLLAMLRSLLPLEVLVKGEVKIISKRSVAGLFKVVMKLYMDAFGRGSINAFQSHKPIYMIQHH